MFEWHCALPILIPHRQNYWTPRDNTEITILVLNVAVTCAVGFLSYKLLKVSAVIAMWVRLTSPQAFGWQTFKKIGASFTINRCYHVCTVVVSVEFC